MRVLFQCTHNQARSQMAEALTHDMSRVQEEALSEGNHPAAHVHPLAVRAIARLGADMIRHVPKSLDQFRGQAFDRIIILYDQDHEDCPTIDTPWVVSWNFPDPTLVDGTELSTRIRLLLTLLDERNVPVHDGNGAFTHLFSNDERCSSCAHIPLPRRYH